MSYATQQNLTDRYGERELRQVTDKSQPPAGTINTATVDRALADADSEIDSRLSVRYIVPIAGDTPPLVVDLACRIARYKLHEDKATDKIRADFDDAIRLLEQVAAGKAKIPGLSPPDTNPDEGSNIGAFAVRAPAPTFTAAVVEQMP